MPQAVLTSRNKVIDALETWADWMREGGVKLGYGKPMGFEQPDRINGWEDFERKTDENMAINVQAVYDGLGEMHQLAIDHHHLAAVWSFRRLSIADVYEAALIQMEVGLRRRGMI
jgi:hypothetical protein